MRYSLLLLAFLYLTACSPTLPTTSPLPTQDATAVVIAAEATVTAMAAADPPVQIEPTPTVTAPAATVTTVPVVTQPGEFWVFYLSNRKLAAMDKNGASTLITDTPGFDYLPTWSPDGKNLAFLRFDGTSTQDGILHILPAGSNTPLQVDPANKYNHMAWLPDNHTLIATRNHPEMMDIYLVDINSGQTKQVAQNASEYPRLSPDGTKLLLLLNNGSPCDGKGCVYPNDFHLYDISSGQTTRLSGDSLPKMGLGWSPDGGSFAFYLSDDTSGKVQLMQANGTPLGAQADKPWWINQWVRSPDGSQIAYAVNLTDSGGVEVYVLPSAGGDARRVVRIDKSTGDEMAYIDTLRWRPDGSGLVFNSWIDVYTVNIDGSDLRKLPVKLENVLFDVRPSADAYEPPPVPTAPATWKLCPGGLDSRLEIGRQARVATNPPAPNNVRSGPFKTSEVIGQIQPGEIVVITLGPVCDEGTIWWEIRSLSTGLTGYTLEGDLKTYWLEPVMN